MKDSTQIKLWLLAFALTCALAWAGHGAITRLVPPPLPKVHKPHKSAAVHQGAGAALLIARIAPEQPKIVAVGKSLAWNYTPNAGNPASNIVFLVCSNSTLLTRRHDYPVIAVTTNLTWPYMVDVIKPSYFFIVMASNIVTHLESL